MTEQDWEMLLWLEEQKRALAEQTRVVYLEPPQEWEPDAADSRPDPEPCPRGILEIEL